MKWLQNWILFWSIGHGVLLTSHWERSVMGLQNKANTWCKTCQAQNEINGVSWKDIYKKTQIDFDETFALDIKWNIVRLVMALTIHMKWELLHLDVNMTFLMVIWRKTFSWWNQKVLKSKGKNRCASFIKPSTSYNKHQKIGMRK